MGSKTTIILFACIFIISCQNQTVEQKRQDKKTRDSLLEIEIHMEKWWFRDKNQWIFSRKNKNFIAREYCNFETQTAKDTLADYCEIAVGIKPFGWDSYSYSETFLLVRANNKQQWQLFHQTAYDSVKFFDKKFDAPNDYRMDGFDMGDKVSKKMQAKLNKSWGDSVYFIPSPCLQLNLNKTYIDSFYNFINDSIFLPHRISLSDQSKKQDNYSFWSIHAWVNKEYYVCYSANDTILEKKLFPYLYYLGKTATVKDTALMRILSQYD